ncbi:MAG: hypothetical protein Q9163_000404 [Psora crenata]
MSRPNNILTLVTAEQGQTQDGSSFFDQNRVINHTGGDQQGGFVKNVAPASPPHKPETEGPQEASPSIIPQGRGIENSTEATPIRSANRPIKVIHSIPPDPLTEPASLLYNTFIYLTIGPKPHGRTFGIHKGLLCQNSKFFAAAFNGPYTEATSGEITLPDEAPDTFDIVYTWLYTGKLTYCKDGEDLACLSVHYVKLFIFGDKYDMPRLCNEAIDGIIHRYEQHSVVYQHNFKHIYKNTPVGSELRRVLVAIYVSQPTEMMGLYDRMADERVACPEFLVDVIKALAVGYEKAVKPAKGKARCIIDRCRFHRHEGGGSCN